MKTRRWKIFAAVAIAVLLLVAGGLRIRTQTGWRVIKAQGLVQAKEHGEAGLRLTLVDTRDKKRRDYRWYFAADDKSVATPSVEIDCGEFKRVLLWKAEIVSFDGHRFRRKIALGEDGAGIDGIYRYEFAWLSKP